MKLYCIADGPPSFSVRQAIKFLNIPCEVITVDLYVGDHMTEEFAKLNPQREIPVLDDGGFCLGESNAILQYICDKYKPDHNLYPKDPKMAPIYFAYERTPRGLRRLHIALDNFNTYLKKQGTKFAAADYITIADFALINSTMCLECIAFDFSKYDQITKWYSTFKKQYPELWEISHEGMKAISYFEKNPPDLSNMDHPIHPVKKNK